MNLEKANYETIIQFGTLYDLQQKLIKEERVIDDVMNIVGSNGISLLEKSIVSRKFDIANYLLDNGANVNIITKEGNNEFHLLAPNLNCVGGIQIGRKLLNEGTSLMHKEYKYGNTAFFSMCMEALKKRSENVLQFIEECFQHVTNVDELNQNDISIRSLIIERGTNQLKERLEELFE